MDIVLKLESIDGATESEKNQFAKALQEELNIIASDYLFEGDPYDEYLPSSLKRKFEKAGTIRIFVDI